MKIIDLNFKKKNKLKALILLSAFVISTLIFSLITNVNDNALINDINSENENNSDLTSNNETPKMSQAHTDYQWWNDSWDFRIFVNVTVGATAQSNIPVELLINFTDYILTFDLSYDEYDLSNVEFAKNSTRVVEYVSATSFNEINSQFDPWDSYDNETNAIGDVIWIIDGPISSYGSGYYFIYFNTNESTYTAPSPNYDIIRLWHEGFEDTEPSEILSVGGSGQDIEGQYLTNWTFSDTIVSRGFRSLEIWGNTWKASAIGTIINIDSNKYITAQIRCEDDDKNPNNDREISGIGFDYDAGGSIPLPSREDSYQLRGRQNGYTTPVTGSPWGYADVQPYDSNWPNWNTYDPNVFNWYTFNLNDEIIQSSINHIYYIADDDPVHTEGFSIHWDDISIWNKTVQTIPDEKPQITVGEVEPVGYSLTVMCVDVDGFRVPYAHVFISNESKSYLNKNKTADSDGVVLFNNVSRIGEYNISVKYTQNGLDNPETGTVFSHNNYEIAEVNSELEAKLHLWTINFNVTDVDGDPIQYGIIELKNSTDDLVGNTTLSSSGTGNIIWANQSAYNYSIYYDYSALTDQSAYTNPLLLIYNGTISRADTNGPTMLNSTRNANDENLEIWEGDKVKTTSNLNNLDGKTISQFNVSVVGIVGNIHEFTVNILVSGTWYNIHTFNNDGQNYHNYEFIYNSSVNEFIGAVQEIELELIKWPLIGSNGTINFDYVLSTLVKNQTKISTANFNVTDKNGIPFENAILKFYNTTDWDAQNLLADVIVDEDGSAKLVSLNNESFGSWGNYTVKVEVGGSIWNFDNNFNEETNKDNLNFTLKHKLFIDIEIILDATAYNSSVHNLIHDPTDLFNDITYRDNVTIVFNFSIHDQGDLDPHPASPDIVYLELLDAEGGGLVTPQINLKSYETALGKFNYTFNTTMKNLKGGYYYNFKITARRNGYTPINESLTELFKVNSLPTNLRVYNYKTAQEYSTDETSEYWNEELYINLYFIETSGTVIPNATITFSWSYHSGTASPDYAKGPGYYFFLFNASKALGTTKYLVEFRAEKENFSTALKNFHVNVNERPTLINGKSGRQRLSQNIYVGDQKSFDFSYTDALDGTNVTDLNELSYQWEKYDSDGKVETNGTGTLSVDENNLYILNFNTKNRTIGEYFLIVYLSKNNYESATALITLNIVERTFSPSLVATGKEGSLITVIKGQPIVMELTLTDPTQGATPSTSSTIKTQASTPLIGATVTMVIAELDRTFTFKEGADGVYTLTIDTTDPDYQAFFMPQTLTANITISKTNYVTQTIDITIVIGMDEWPIPGFPAFYFIMIVGAIIAVVGSLATYRYIQLAKIPKFVKNARAMKKAMKERGEISESLLYPSKEEYMVKILGDKWEAIGLSLEDILGIERKKSKIAPGTEEITEELDGGVV